MIISYIVIHFMVTRSKQIFVHATTAMLLRHVQKFLAIGSLVFRSVQN